MSIFKKHIDTIGAYTPPLDGRDPHRFTLLDFNERTVPLSPVVQEALVDYIRAGRLQMYPAYGDVVQVIARIPKPELKICPVRKWEDNDRNGQQS